jgi:TRAP transporter TAXI family solute receptor
VKKQIGACAASLLLLSLCVIHPAVHAKTTFITIGTGGLTGVYYPTGGAIAKIVNQQRKKYGLRCTVESTNGSVYNVNAVLAGEFDFGIVQSDRQYQATKGIADWKEPQTKLRAVFSIYPESVSLLAAIDANINTLSDLKGKRVNLGNSGSGHLGNSLDVLKSSGLDPKTDIIAQYIRPVKAPGLLQDGMTDAFFYTVGHPSGALREAISGARKVRFVPLMNKEIDRLVASLPYYSKMVIPVKEYPGVQNTHDIPTFGVCATLVTSSEISDKVVYAVTKAVFEDLGSFKKLHPAYTLVTKKNMLECLSAPIHPGAMKYYQEAGLK